MIGRLGNVLYWASSGIAAILALIGTIATISAILHGRDNIESNLFVLAIYLVAAALAWLAGRACRYVLAGR